MSFLLLIWMNLFSILFAYPTKRINAPFRYATLLPYSSCKTLMKGRGINMNSHTLDTICKTVGHFHAIKHIFICADQSKPKCCNYEESLVSWEHLKKRVKEINSAAKGGDDTRTDTPKQLLFSVSRTKANCLQVCVPQSGPIVVVYPDAVWYHSCTPEVLDLILESHIRNGIPVEQYRFNRGNQIESNSCQPQPNSS